MFNNLRRYYNQNRKRIWRVIIIIAFAFAMLQLANTIAKSNNERQIREATAQTRTQTTTASSESNTVSSGESSSDISSSSTQTSETKARIATIDQFVTYCNNQDLNSAYNMLTDNCKQEMFSNIDIFKNIYYDSTFENMQKEATIENWANNTYMVKFTENALATGKIAVTKEEQNIDYITVVNEEDNYKLNINSFIGYKTISKTKKENDVTIEVIGKHTYMNYETYTLKVANQSENTVILDNLYNSKGIYIEDTKGVTYPMYNGELTSSMVTIDSGHTKQLDIKFFSNYVSTKQIKQLVFSNYRNGKNQTTLKITL